MIIMNVDRYIILQIVIKEEFLLIFPSLTFVLRICGSTRGRDENE